MAGRTTLIIAHRLSTIALADEIVVLEHGACRGARQPRRAARALAAVPRDRREGRCPTGLPDAQAAPPRGGGAVSPGVAARWRPLAAELAPARNRAARAAATCAASLRCSRPYRWRVVADGASRSSSAPPRRSRRRCSRKLAIDDGIVKHDTDNARADRRRVPVAAALVVWVTTSAQTYLVEWVGQRALADLRLAIFAPPAATAGRLLRAPPGRRPDLAHDQRRRGARQASSPTAS